MAKLLIVGMFLFFLPGFGYAQPIQSRVTGDGVVHFSNQPTQTKTEATEKPGIRGCHKAGARKILADMHPRMVASESIDAGWIIVTFGSDYFYWTERQTEGLVTAYANADACITGKARSLEFRSPSGKLIARADSFSGIQMK